MVTEEVAKASDESTAAELRRQYGKMSIPSVMPVFQQLVVDPAGNLWLQVFRSADAGRPGWVVFDPGGTVLGRISTPRGLTIAQIGNDYILGLACDDSDVEHVVRYRLRRS